MERFDKLREIALERSIVFHNRPVLGGNPPLDRIEVLETANMFLDFLSGRASFEPRPKVNPDLVITSEPIAVREGVEVKPTINKN